MSLHVQFSVHEVVELSPRIAEAVRGDDHRKQLEDFKRRCAETKGELDITDRDRLLKGGDHGPAMVPGEPKKSLLYLMAAHDKKPAMPYKAPKLADETIRHIAAWIENGAPYDSPLVARKDSAAWIEKKIEPEAKLHWAFQPIKQFAPPAVRDEKWIKSELDRFILARLEAKGITPNPAVSKRV